MTLAISSTSGKELVQSSRLADSGVAQSLVDNLSRSMSAVSSRDLVARETMLARTSRSIRNLFVACKNFGVYTCTTVKLLAQRSAIPIALAAALAHIPGMPYFPVLSALNGGYLSKFSSHLLAGALGNFANAALNLATSGKFDVCARKTLEFLLKFVKNAAFPAILATMLHYGFGFNLNFRPDLFAKVGLSSLVAKLAASNAGQVAVMASIGTLVNAVSGLVNASVAGAARLGAHAYLIAKIVTIQTFPLALIVFPILLGLCRRFSISATLCLFVISATLFIADKFATSGKFIGIPLFAFQTTLTIAEIPFRLICSLLYAKDFRDAVEIIKTELVSIPYNKLKILQKPQIQFRGLEAAKLDESEMVDVKAALAIAGEARGGLERNPAKLREALMKRNLILIDSTEIPDSIPSGEGREAMKAFLDDLSLNDEKFHLEDGVIKTKSGMQATLAYDLNTQTMRVFYHGTDFKATPRGVKTIMADVQIVGSVNAAKEMADDATQLLQLAKEAFGANRCRAIGHSLGGGLCQIVCARTKIIGTSINPAPVNEDFFAKLEREDLEFVREKCIQISLKGDLLSNVLLTRNGGCVQLFGRKINIPFSGFENEHEAAVALKAINQIETQDRVEAMNDAQNLLRSVRSKIGACENKINRLSAELAKLTNDQNFLPDLKGEKREKYKTKLQQDISEARERKGAFALRENRLKERATRAIEETQEILNKAMAVINEG
ncbi:MAG: hypothetical protein LBD33_00540 [Puniceicoccales bacterium]|jgi:hypothetical protein|nr:hypothetical protein [Puniceicoccales bacterium]